MADEVISKVRVPDGTSNVYVLKDEIARSRTEYETVTKTGNPLVLEAGGQTIDDIKVGLEPIQDLHGYDHPWPAGGGNNKLLLSDIDASSTLQGVNATWSANNEELTVNGTNTGSYAILISFHMSGGHLTIPNLSVGETWTLSATLPVGMYAGIVYKNTSDAEIQHWYINGDGTYKCIVQNVPNDFVSVVRVQIGINPNASFNNDKIHFAFESGTSSASWTPYSNICPITGRTEASATRTGKNLYNKTQYPFTQFSVYNPSVCWTPLIFVKHGTYTFSCSSGFGYCYISVYKTFEDATAKTNMLAQYVFNNGSSITRTFDEDVYVRYQQNDTGGTDEDYATVSQSWQTELGTEATEYEHYQGQSVTVQLGQTVYGGTVDLITGVLTLTKGYTLLNGSDGSTYRNNGQSSITTRAYVSVPGKAYGIANMISDKFCTPTSLVYDNVGIMDGRPSNNGIEFFLDRSVPDTTAGVTAWFANNPTQLVYELATPQTIQLTPQQLKTLVGTNVISTDGDTLEVTLRDGLFMLAGDGEANETAINSIAGSLAMVETSPATANHAVGDLIVFNNQLYKVTAAIASGEAIVEGTNVSSTTVADEFMAMLAQLSA